LALTIPSAVLLAIGLEPVITRAFPAFSAADVGLVVWVTRLYLAGLTGHALLEIASRSFYAQQEARVPLYAAAINTGIFILLAIILTQAIGAGGIALAGTIAFTGEALVLLWLLSRRFSGLLRSRATLLRTGIATVLGGFLVYGLIEWAPIPALFASLGGMLLGFMLAILCVLPELKDFMRLGRQSAPAKGTLLTERPTPTAP
jgi:putative peptidoglycan lipid II flippase